MKKYYKSYIILASLMVSLCSALRAVDLIDDTDNDGWSDVEEVLAGTSATNSISFPRPKVNVSSLYDGIVGDYSYHPLFVYSYNDTSSPNMGGRYDSVVKPISSRITESVMFGADGNASLSQVKIAPRTVRILGHRHAICDIPKDSSSGSLWCYYSGSPVVNYNTGAISGGPHGVSAEISYEKTDSIDTHLRSGWNRFFGFLDLNGNSTYDTDEPAGLSIQKPTFVDSSNDVDIVIALSDYLVGYPRLSWSAGTNINYNSDDSYVVTISSGAITHTVTVKTPRTFLHEGDFIAAGINGLDFGASTEATFDYSVSLREDVISTGSFYYNLGSTDRLTMEIIYPTTNDVVNGSEVEFKWKMDYRNEGVRLSITETNTSTTCYDELINFPVRHGQITDSSYYYSATPQNLDGRSSFILPSGNYVYTFKEYVRTGALSKQEITGAFEIL